MSKRLSKTPTEPENTTAFTNEIKARLLTLESDLGSRMDEIESTLGTNTADIEEHSKRLMRCETSGLELEPNNTNNPLLDISHRIGILEAYQTQDRAGFFDVRTKLDSIETNIEENSMKLAKVETELATNKTNYDLDLQDIRHRVGILESYQNQDRAEFREMDSRLGISEQELDTYTQSIKNNSKMLSELTTDVWKIKTEQALHQTELQEMNIAINENANNLTKFETNLEEEKSGLQNLSSIIEGLDLNANTEFVSMQNFTTELRNIYDDIQREKFINEEHDLAISKLDANGNFLTNVTQNHTSRIVQLELYRDTDHSAIKLNQGKIEELVDNLTSENLVIKAHGDSILAVTNSLLDLEADTHAQNASLFVQMNSLTQLELDRTDDRDLIQSQDSRLAFVEIEVMSQNTTLQNHSSRIEELESDTIRDQDIIANYSLRLSELERLTKETRNEMIDYGTKLTKLTGNISLVLIASKVQLNHFIISRVSVGDYRKYDVKYTTPNLIRAKILILIAGGPAYLIPKIL